MSRRHQPHPPALVSLLLVALVGLAPALEAQWVQTHELLGTGGQADDQFGSAVATDGALVLVGAPRADGPGADAGTAELFVAATGAPLLELVPLAGAAGDRFGSAVALDDGLAVVGAPLADHVGADAGRVLVFDAASGVQLLELTHPSPTPGNQFGTAVALDGGLLVVGSVSGASLFDAVNGDWLLDLVPDGGLPVGGTGVATVAGGFGQAVALGGDRIVVGARTANGASLYSGAAYVFDTRGDELAVLSSGPAWSHFGGSVAVDDGRVAVGAQFASPYGKDSGAAFLYDADSGQLITVLDRGDGHIFQHFGSSVAIDGARVVVGAEWDNGGSFSSGAAYVFDAPGGTPTSKLKAGDGLANDELGFAVASGGDVVVVGAPRDDALGDASGSAHVFGDSVWTELGQALAGTHGEPSLTLAGPLTGGSTVEVALADALASAPCWAIAAVNELSAPFKGGILVPQPEVILPLVTTPVGALDLSFTWPVGVPAGVPSWYQVWIQDPGAVLGFAASNAVRGTAP